MIFSQLAERDFSFFELIFHITEMPNENSDSDFNVTTKIVSNENISLFESLIYVISHV
jgi:hypothetical protein